MKTPTENTADGSPPERRGDAASPSPDGEQDVAVPEADPRMADPVSLTADERRSLWRALLDPVAWSAYGIVVGIGFPLVVLGAYFLDPHTGQAGDPDRARSFFTLSSPAVFLALLGLVHVAGSLAAGQALLARTVGAPLRPRTAILAAGRYVIREPLGAVVAAALQAALIVAVILLAVSVGFGIGSSLSGPSINAALITGTALTVLLIAAGCAAALGTVPAALVSQRLRGGMAQAEAQGPLARAPHRRRFAVLLGLVSIAALLCLMLRPSEPGALVLLALLPPVLLLVHLAHMQASIRGALQVLAVYTGDAPRRTPRITPFLPFLALSVPALLVILLG